MASSHSGVGLNTSLDTHKSVRTDSKLYFDRKLGVKRDPLHPLRANQHRDSWRTLYKYQVLTHSWLSELSSSVVHAYLKTNAQSSTGRMVGDLFKVHLDYFIPPIVFLQPFCLPHQSCQRSLTLMRCSVLSLLCRVSNFVQIWGSHFY